jgi:hypothetical protein
VNMTFGAEGQQPIHPDSLALTVQRIRTLALPATWRLVVSGDDGEAWARTDGLKVIWSMADEADEHRWLHVSVSRHDGKLPTYEHMCEVHRRFIGRDRYSYEVHAPQAKHVNINPGVLHLWAVVDGPEPLPDFTRGGATL